MGFSYYRSPFGLVKIVTEQDAVICLRFVSEMDTPEEPDALSRQTAQQLEEYFAGERKSFDFPMNPHGTPFQKTVWAALCRIPYGQTRSYQEIAREIGRETACRAVGMANSRNPIWVAIPCHRVIGKNGSLTGYAGGMDLKEKLLAFEYDKGLSH